MTRPTYETPQDLSNELRVARAFARDGAIEKLPCGGRYTIDYGIFRDGHMVAVMEVKCRPGWREHFGDVILGLSKARELNNYEREGLCRAFFVVELGDLGIHWVRMNNWEASWKIRWSGRSDRGDDYDHEPCLHIPFEAFRLLK